MLRCSRSELLRDALATSERATMAGHICEEFGVLLRLLHSHANIGQVIAGERSQACPLL
jgi:hypothetical protein